MSLEEAELNLEESRALVAKAEEIAERLREARDSCTGQAWEDADRRYTAVKGRVKAMRRELAEFEEFVFEWALDQTLAEL